MCLSRSCSDSCRHSANNPMLQKQSRYRVESQLSGEGGAKQLLLGGGGDSTLHFLLTCLSLSTLGLSGG